MTQVTIPPALGGDGLPFSDDGTSARDMRGQGYAANFFPMLGQVMAAVQVGVQAAGAVATGSTNVSSTTSLAIGTGAKALTVETGKALVPGMWMLLASRTDPHNSMTGRIVTYDASTGSLALFVSATTGGGTYADWSGSVTGAPSGTPDLVRNANTSAYTAVAGDKGKLLDCAGTWTLGFTAAATLGAGWWCYVRNDGTGTITADPNGAELIDGLTSGAIPPGMTLLVICDGTALYCVKVGPRVAVSVLTTGTSGTVPLGARNIRARVQGAGGRGTSGPMCGAYAEAYLNVIPGASYTYAIGASATSTGPGGDTTLTMGGRTITCKGGTQSQSSFVTAAGGDINIAGSASNTWPVASPLGAGGSSSTNAAGYGGASTDVNSGAGVIILEY